jgi:hypothetical protein
MAATTLKSILTSQNADVTPNHAAMKVSVMRCVGKTCYSMLYIWAHESMSKQFHITHEFWKPDSGFVAHLPKYQLLAFLRSRSRSPRLWKKGATSQTWRLRVACRVHMRARALCGGRHCWKAAGTVAVTVTFRIQWCKLGMTSHISSSPLARCADAIRQHQWGKDLFCKETETRQ